MERFIRLRIASGNVVSASVYNAFGRASTSGSWTDPWGFNARWGDYYDRESEYYYCENRYYDPVGRWVTRDPIGAAGGVNLYGYCEEGPVGSSDPSGLKIEVIAGGDLRDIINNQLNMLRDPKSPTAAMMREYDCSDEVTYIDSVPDNQGHRPGWSGSLAGASPYYYDNTKQGAPAGRHIFYDPRHTGHAHEGDGLREIPFPPDVVLAHELGHRNPNSPDDQRYPDPKTHTVAPGDVVNEVENPYRTYRRLPRRAYYGIDVTG